MVGGHFLSAAIAVSVLGYNTLAAQTPIPAAKLGPGVWQSILEGPKGTEHLRKGDGSAKNTKSIPKAYIVELKTGASLGGRSDDLHISFHKRAEEANIDYEVRREFTDKSLFYGLSIELSKEDEREVLEALPEVRRVWPVVEIKRPTPVGFENFDVGGPVAPEYGFNTSVIRSEDYKIDYNLKMAGVDHLHSRGIKGKGVKIAIIDTGVDYRHPALGGEFGPGKKVAFGRNYIDDGQGSSDDPIATCAAGGHGTHVAGIIAGEDPKDKGFGLLGVAPEATLGMYRVFSCGGLAASDTVLQAMIDSVNDGANIVSMSLGSDTGFERADPYGQVITNAKNNGVTFVVAAGNSGHNGPILSSSPAVAIDAVAVASVDSARYPTTYKVKSNRGGEWRYSSLWPVMGEFNVFAAPDYDESLGCDFESLQKAIEKVEEYGWDITKTFYMVRQNERCSLDGAVLNSYYYGFKAVIAWRDHEFPNPYDNDYVGSAPPLFTLSIDHIDGPKLYDAIKVDPRNFRLRFTDQRFLAVDNPSAGLTSNYSSLGNTWEYNAFKPLISAPGHLILSSWPLEAGGYTIISGTSMATPFVAGCYALLKSVYPKLSVDELTNLFSTTAVPSKYWGDKDIVHSVTHQGAGTINVWNAYNSGVKFEDGVVVLGQSEKPVTRNITFTNTLGRPKTFEVSHVPAGLMKLVPYPDLGAAPWRLYGNPSLPTYAKVEFEGATTITLDPGETTTVSFVVTPPAGLDPDTIPQHSGFIKFVSGRDVYSVPYMGLPYVINEAPVLERDLVDGFLLPSMIQTFDESGNPIYAHNDVVEFDPANYEFVNMVYFARQPSDAYRVDVVPANTTFEPTYYGFNKSHIIETHTPDIRVVDTFGNVESFGTVFYDTFLPPIYHYLSWYGGFDDIGVLPPGDYRWLLRVLPLEKDPEDPKSWTSWLSPVMRFPEP